MSLIGSLLLLGTYTLGGLAWGDEALVNAGPADSKVTLGDVRNVPPQEAGDKLLGDLKHAPVVTVRNFTLPSNDRPVELLESPTRVAEGCQRLRWMAIFRMVPGAPQTSAWLSHVISSREIGLAGPKGCEGAKFARLSPGMDRDTAFRLLGLLNEIAVGTRKVSFDCKSRGRKICASPEAIRAELTRPVNLLISLDKGVVEFTYLAKTPGWDPATSLYMTVKLDAERPRRVTVLDMPVADAPASPPRYDVPPPPVIVLN